MLSNLILKTVFEAYADTGLHVSQWHYGMAHCTRLWLVYCHRRPKTPAEMFLTPLQRQNRAPVYGVETAGGAV